MPAVNKHLEKAERLVQKGKLEAALEEYLVARQEDPGNAAIVVTLADLYQRLNRPRDSRQCFGFLFDKAVANNNATAALECFDHLQKFGPIEPKRLIACAQLIQKQQPQQAIEYYTQALDAVGGQDHEAALQCLQALAALQPSSLEIHQRLAELASKSGKKAVASPAYTRLGELLISAKRYEEAIQALEEAYRLSDGAAAERMQLAKLCSQCERFARILELLGQEGEQTDDPAVLELMAEAYLAEKKLPEAEHAYWKLSETSSSAFDALTAIAMQYLRQENVSQALPLLNKLEERLSAGKQQRGLIALAEQLGGIEFADIAVLEFLSHLADQLNLDSPLTTALNGLFDYYFTAGDFHKATDVLERLIDIDAYDPECYTKLQRLEGKADPALWKELAGRLSKTSTVAESPLPPPSSPGAAEQPEDPEAAAATGASLGDLILQAEIFLQYKLEDKARERLQRIVKLFPGEEEKNEELRALYERTNFNPRAAAPGKGAASAPKGQLDWTSISEVIRNLSRQAAVKGVLSTAVNHIGRLWQAGRCIVALATLNRPPSMVLEYISPGIAASDAALLGKLVVGLQQIGERQGSAIVAERVAGTPALEPLKAPLAALGVQSLVAIVLREGDRPAGILLLEECNAPRSWKPNELAALETLAEQIVLAVSNVRLRSLMRSLAVTDERSGLLHRDSYLPCLISEVERMRAQKTPLSAVIFDFQPAPQDRDRQSEDLDEFVRQFGSAFASHLRHNDIALKYGPHSLVVIMPGTNAKDAVLVVEKMRRLSASFSGAATPPMAAGVAEIVQDGEMDAVDTVTELINRVEAALEAAQSNGGGTTKVIEPPTLPR